MPNENSDFAYADRYSMSMQRIEQALGIFQAEMNSGLANDTQSKIPKGALYCSKTSNHIRFKFEENKSYNYDSNRIVSVGNVIGIRILV